MQNTNPPAGGQIKNLLNDFKRVNEKTKNYLSEVDRRIAELDIKYAQGLVKNNINILQAAKSILLSKNK